jgi:hypothetical protein
MHRAAALPAPTASMLAAALTHANMAAFWELVEDPACQRARAEEGEPALVHWIARGNAVTAFKLMLTKCPVALAAQTDSQRTFMHWAANFGAFNVARFWTEVLGTTDCLLERDNADLLPADIARAVELAAEKDGERRLLDLLLRTTQRAADAAIDGES